MMSITTEMASAVLKHSEAWPTPLTRSQHMQSSHAITSAHVQPFSFHETVIEVAQNNGDLWVSIRRVCEAVGVAFTNQIAKLKARAWARIESIPMVSADGKTYDTAMLHLDSLPMWLATIEPSRVAPEARKKLEVFQVECAKALRDHFFGPLKARKDLHEEPAPIVHVPTIPLHEVDLGRNPSHEAYEAKRAAIRAHVAESLAAASRAANQAWSFEEKNQAIRLYGSLGKLLGFAIEEVTLFRDPITSSHPSPHLARLEEAVQAFGVARMLARPMASTPAPPLPPPPKPKPEPELIWRTNRPGHY